MSSCRLVRLGSPGETWLGDIFCRPFLVASIHACFQQETAVIQTSSAVPTQFRPQHSGDSFALMSGFCCFTAVQTFNSKDDNGPVSIL
jgi:hypothetical protein